MKLSRLVGLIFAAVLAVNLIAVAMASAAAPEFNPGTATALTTTTGTASLCKRLRPTQLRARAALRQAKVTSVKTVGNLKVTFSGCSDKEGSG